MVNIVRKYRHYRGMTQTELAFAAGITQQALSRIERGDVEPVVTTAIKIARALKISVEEIFIVE